MRPIDLPKFERDEELVARLVPGVEKSRRRGYKPTTLQVRKAPGRMSLKWDAATREARISSPDVSRVGELFLNVNQLVNNAPPHDDLSKVQIPPGMLMTAAAPDVVIDVGMSKTVVVTAQRGLFSVQTLLDLVRPTQAVPARVAPPAPAGAEAAPPRLLSARDLQAAEPPPDYAREAREEVREERPSAVNGEAPPTPAVAPSGGGGQVEAAPIPVAPVEGFGAQLERVIGEIGIAGIKQVGADLTMLLLSLAVRPFVLLAGPPGSGKSTLVRIAAKLLNTEATKSYFEIAVQPHWRHGGELPESASPQFQEALSVPVRMFLFDEFNMARPEHYLMPFFQLLDAFAKQPSRGRMLACGTLNIDDTSRPPSPKIIDRCFMIEIDASAKGPQPDLSMLLSEIDVLPVLSLPIVSKLVDGQRPRLWGPVGEVIQVIHETVDNLNLRQDLLPSRRVLNDIAALLQLHDEAGIPKSLLPEDELVDRALAGRMLVKLSGAAEQVDPLVRALEQHFKASPYKRCRRRIALALAQIQQLGFVSPWQ
ncbi:MAG TPA: AAA family ATPase [Archangium sp.]|nr:AAA family ATPase [Archangium sp.]